MGVNKYLPHIHVLPEDEANRQLANGFVLGLSGFANRIQIMPNAGGWRKVLYDFRNNYRDDMSRYQARNIVLMVDFDNDGDRLATILNDIPEYLFDRVFVLGVRSEPEELKAAGLGSLEEVGVRLAKECKEEATTTWNHDLLANNASELRRMAPILKPILFPAG